MEKLSINGFEVVYQDSEFEEFTWGRKYKVLETGSLLIDILEIVAGGFSSIHLHNYQSNLMHVIYGNLIIRLFDSCTKELLETLNFKPHEEVIIPPDVIHQFEACGKVKVLEIVTPSISREDIVRFSERGIKDG